MKLKLSLLAKSACALILLLSIDGCHGLFSTSAQAVSYSFHGPLKVALQEDLFNKSLEKDLVTSFAFTHSIKIKFVSFKDVAEAEHLLNQGDVDSVFTRSSLKDTDFKNHFSMIYDDLKLDVICSSNLDAATELYVPERYLHLAQTESFIQVFKKLHWTNTSLANAKLTRLALKTPGICYLADSRLALKNRIANAQLKTVWTSQKSESVAWITHYDLKDLNQLMHAWFQGLVRQNELRKFWDQYEAFEFKMSILEQRRFQKDVVQKLPQWRPLFEQAAKKNKVPWTLLAAVSYQESKWNQDATSYTGVRGLMQLTSRTARHLGIEDREDPAQSIDGGAFYLKYLYDKTSPKISNYERWAQALAAYNIGWAHIRDARNLSHKLNRDSQRWLQFKTILPLLSDEKYAASLAFGLARGEETVEFVDQVFGYNEVLNNSFTRRLLTSQDF